MPETIFNPPGYQKNNKSKKIVIIVLVILVLLVAAFFFGYFYQKNKWSVSDIFTFESDCAKEGGSISVTGKFKKCCGSLKPVRPYRMIDTAQDTKPLLLTVDFYKGDIACTGLPGGMDCVRCGNGKCGKGENICNCPQDCKE
ncbi:MAG: hypothetical protein WC528_01650 [Patescibacteria group bacterium]